MAIDILLLGKDGQVGWELQRALAPLGRIIAPTFEQCDLSNAEQLRETVRLVRPALIVNAAAYTAVDKAESEPEIASAVNGVAPGILAEEAKQLGAWLVHYSTDYVFDGSKQQPYAEQDTPAPLNVYGDTKLEGEQAILASGCKHLILRTSWVFAARGGNFAKTILRLARERESLKIVGDQFGAPTSAELLADVTALCVHDLMRPGGETPQGLYHLVAGGRTSWHGYACFILDHAARLGYELKCNAGAVESIPTEGYPVPAKRPANSVLDTTKIRRTFNIELPDWTWHVQRMLEELLGSGE